MTGPDGSEITTTNCSCPHCQPVCPHCGRPYGLWPGGLAPYVPYNPYPYYPFSPYPYYTFTCNTGGATLT